MSAPVDPIKIGILGKDYHIACEEAERDALLESARYLDKKMHEVRATGRVVGQERIAVMAALNIAHELMQIQKSTHWPSDDVCKRLTELQERIDTAIEPVDDSGNSA